MTAGLAEHRQLLATAARLYERGRANRKRPFNVFSVLRSASDEVNLHSRFLHALLDHVDPFTGKRENLDRFLKDVAEAGDFAVPDARVEREVDNIDLLISNGRQAVVIENKVWARDQDRQLQRYRDALVEQGYDEDEIRLLYLTPYGHRPEAQSTGDIPTDRIKCVSYRNLPGDWLLGCRQRAVDDPGLRESIAQYVRLVRKITNSDYEADYMNGMKELLLSGDNLVLASQLSRVLEDAQAACLEKFYGTVDRTLHDAICDLPPIDPEWAHLASEPFIKRAVSGARRLAAGLFYPVTKGAWLAVTGGDRLWFGVWCEQAETPDLHRKAPRCVSEQCGRARRCPLGTVVALPRSAA